jgi:hypothetical protein
MATVFDLLTVSCFTGLVVAFFQYTDRDTQVLLRLLPAAIAFAVANELGNRGAGIFAAILIFAGAGYALLVLRK